MSKIKIFTKELEHVDILEYHVNKFLEEVELVSINTNIAKDKYGIDIVVVTIAYDEGEEDFEEDVEFEEEEV